MTQQERELVWLIDKVVEDESFILQAEAFFEEHHLEWSSELAAYFRDELKRIKDQLNYKEHRLERLSWEIIQIREDLEVPELVRYASNGVDGCLCRLRHPRGGDALAQ